ncbi:LysR family transcriptional regulator substrate-binding protein [Aeromicrobium sp. UC242_57]|uniref:LysR family transcriptional regulator substrate-binding protein n=1 Tax=Aeromicrobium sp. UC242_57 TaxID=3374624 RepID=UPI0037966818
MLRCSSATAAPSKPTSAGEALLPHAQRILIDVESAQRAVHEVASLRRGRVRLGATPSLCDGVLPEALTRFHAAYPQIDLEVHEAGSRLLTRELAQGRLDVALLIIPLPSNEPDIETTPVLRERLVLASPADSELPSHMDVQGLRDLPLVMFREGYDLRDVTLRACAAAGFEPRLAVEGGEMSAVLRFVEAGLGHAVVPSMVLSTRPQRRPPSWRILRWTESSPWPIASRMRCPWRCRPSSRTCSTT